MNSTTLEPDLGDFERRVKPKVEDAPCHPETPITTFKPKESDPQNPMFGYANERDQALPCHMSVSGQLKSDEPLVPPGSDASSGSDSRCHDVQSNIANPCNVSEDVSRIDICPAREEQSDVLPSSSQSVQICSGGSGECTTPHLPVKVRGMCNSCYQKEWRRKNAANIYPVAYQAQCESKPRPIIDPRILCDEYGVPMLDSFGIPIQIPSAPPKVKLLAVPVLPDLVDDVLRFHEERLKCAGLPLDASYNSSAVSYRRNPPTFPVKLPPMSPVTFDVGDIVRHKRLGHEVEVTEVKDNGKKMRYRQKSGFVENFTDTQAFELVRKRPVAPVAAVPVDDPSVPLDPVKLFPDSAALDRYHCPIDNLKYGENPAENFLCGCARCYCFKGALLSALDERGLTLSKEAVRADRTVAIRNSHLVCFVVRFDQAADFTLSDGRLARDLMKNGACKSSASKHALFMECGARSIALSGMDAGALEMFDKLVQDHVQKNSQEWKDAQQQRAAEKDRLESIRKEERLNEARSKIVVKQLTKIFDEYIPNEPPVKLHARVQDSWQSAYSVQCFQLYKKPDFVLCQEVLTSLLAANHNGLFNQVTPKLQEIIVRHVSMKEHYSRHMMPTEVSTSLQKRVSSEDLSLAAQACVVSFSRHVDLLEPFIERSVVAAMREVPQLEPASEPDELPQPSNIVGTMRPYQIKGLNWLIQQHRKSIGSILADEMGLGKTIQTISFIAHLLLTQERPTPHLIVVPLSVLSNWGNEFKKFCPSIRVKRIHVYSGNEAIKIFREIAHPCCPYDVIMTTYEVIRSDFWISKFVRINWHTLVLDEGHRIKNEHTEAAHTCSLIRARFRLILTGTPIQNNMHESWALLNFLNPRVFTASKTFDESFNFNAHNASGLQVSQELMAQCHKIMRLVFLRRLKSEVEMTLPPKLETRINCPMSEMQTFFTQRLLLRSSSIIKRMEEQRASTGHVSGDDMKKLQSLIMQLRKAANHPYLFDGAEDPELYGATSDEIVTASGKMVWLDALLAQLLKKGHRVVIFSQFTRVLDIICDYLDLKHMRHSRLDGKTNRVIRQILIDQFNRPDSKENIFVASTRAGGEGINLQTADTVILFDSDWNPQKDIQAMGRVHRIGQTRVVHIYRFVTSGSVEERILQRQQQKLYLDSCVIRGSTAISQAIDDQELIEGDADAPEDEEPLIKPSAVMEALKFGWNSVFTPDASKDGACDVSPQTVEALIDRSRGTADDSDSDRTLLEGQQCSVSSFNIEQPLVSTHLLNGELLDSSAAEDDVQAIASSWNQSRYASRLADATPIYASKPIQNNWSHDDICMACGDGGELLLCNLCPASYHLECIGVEQVPAGRWTCPHHFCCVCERKSQDCSNCLFRCPANIYFHAPAARSLRFCRIWEPSNFFRRCEMCPCAFCEDCKPDDMSFLPINDCRFTKRGFKVPTNAYYIHCSDECRAAATQLM